MIILACLFPQENSDHRKAAYGVISIPAPLLMSVHQQNGTKEFFTQQIKPERSSEAGVTQKERH